MKWYDKVLSKIGLVRKSVAEATLEVAVGDVKKHLKHANSEVRSLNDTIRDLEAELLPCRQAYGDVSVLKNALKLRQLSRRAVEMSA